MVTRWRYSEAVRATELLDEVRRAREHGIDTGAVAVD